MKTYRLLRNNKESGPYEAEQIIGMGLKAYDLIWAEGKSAAWRYPGELEEFKSYAPLVEEQPYDRFYKRKQEPEKAAPIPNLKRDAAEAILPAEPVKIISPNRSFINPENTGIQPATKKETVIPVIAEEKVKIAYKNNFFSKPSNTEQQIKGIMVIVGEKKATPEKGLFEIRDKVVNEPIVQYETMPLFAEKPRIKIKAETRRIDTVQKVLVQEVTASVPEKIIQIVSSKPANWEHAWLDWEQEKKAAAYAEKRIPEIKSNADTEAPEIKIKFSQSLDEIKEQYAATVLKHKVGTKNIIPSKPQQWLGYAGGIAILLVFGFWMGGLKNKKSDSLTNVATTQLTSNENLPTKEENIVPEEIIDNSSQNSANDQNTQTLVYTIPKRNSTPSEKLSTKQTKAADNFKYTPVVQKKQAAIPAQKSVSDDKNGRSASYRKIETTTNTPVVTTIEDNKPVNNLPKARTVNDFIQLGSGSIALNEGASGNQLQVKNSSDINFNLIVIDLQYFDGNGKYRKGETLYLKNFNGGQSIHVKIPEDKSSSKVTAAVSMISSDEKNIYLIAE